MDLEAARQLIIKLQASLEARELQLERKLEEVASMQDTTQQVMVSLPQLMRRRHSAECIHMRPVHPP